jgi:hypothetical protein
MGESEKKKSPFGRKLMASNNVNGELERRLWDVADELRVNLKLNVSFSIPMEIEGNVLGEISLRRAETAGWPSHLRTSNCQSTMEGS